MLRKAISRAGRCRAASSAALLLGLSLAPAVGAQVLEPPGAPLGPIPLRAISPLRLLFFQLTPEVARTLGGEEWSLDLDLSESNVLHIRNAPPTEFDADLNLEITRLNLRFNYGVADRWDLAVEAPLYRFHSGFMDSSIREVEDLFGDLKVQRRFEQEFPGADSFRFFLKRNGETFFELPGPRSGLGDIAVTAKRMVLAQSGRRPTLAVRCGVKLPTGSEKDAMGSGDVDVAAGLAADYQRSGWGIHGNLNVTLPQGDLFSSVGLKTRTIWSGHVGGAVRVSRNWVFHTQFAATSEPFELDDRRAPSPLRAEPSENFTGSIVELSLGASRGLGPRATFFVAVVEEVLNTTNAAADATLLVSVKLRSRGS